MQNSKYKATKGDLNKKKSTSDLKDKPICEVKGLVIKVPDQKIELLCTLPSKEHDLD